MHLQSSMPPRCYTLSATPKLHASTTCSPPLELHIRHASNAPPELQSSMPPRLHTGSAPPVLRTSIRLCLYVATLAASLRLRQSIPPSSYVPSSHIPSSYLHTDSGFASTIELCARSFEHREHHASIHTSMSLQPTAYVRSSRAPYLYISISTPYDCSAPPELRSSIPLHVAA